MKLLNILLNYSVIGIRHRYITSIVSFSLKLKYCYLSVEVIMQVPFLVLCTQHVHDFAVLWSASWALSLTLSITFKAVLMEGVAAQEMN